MSLIQQRIYLSPVFYFVICFSKLDLYSKTKGKYRVFGKTPH